ncbi:MAG: excinuclease ABC subunit UvrC [Patescibacteria group bacterium]|jgi:excinuclease ABC subunit C
MPINLSKIKIPQSPGCYIMKDRSGDILYIGKAKNLSKRVKSYWQKTHADWKTDELLGSVVDIEFIVTRNEVEALLLEARLIRQHKPRFNLMLKENQPYTYIKITDEEFPRLVSVRTIGSDGKYFGPFVSGKGKKYLMLTTARLFGLRTDRFISRSGRELYKLLSEIKERDLEKISATEYQYNVRLAEMFLRGSKEQLLVELERKMKKASAEQNFELARLYRDHIRSIKNFSEKQLILLPKNYDQDVINCVVVSDKALVQVFNINKGIVTSRNHFELQVAGQGLAEILSGFVEQYYLTRPVPRELILPVEPTDKSLLVRYMESFKGSKVEILVPKTGDKKKLLDLVRQNILVRLNAGPLAELQARLQLPRLPEEIDGFDISNTSGKEAVGSCVHFSGGKPNKNLYRKFKIKTVSGPNDYAMMEEVMSRRYAHKGWVMPDLILVDGGKGQLGIALKVLAKLGLDLPVISLAKKREEIFIPGYREPIVLERRSDGLKLLQNIRDEAHRFAIGYHKLLRGKRS